jgi:SAM-dependent methyltransferase
MGRDATIRMEDLATLENYDEKYYVATNPDVEGYLPSPYQHLIEHGLSEGRKIRFDGKVIAAKAEKIKRIEKLIKPGLPHAMIKNSCGEALCFLDDDLKAQFGVEDTENVSAHGYGPEVVAMIEEFKDGLLLDCGAGRRPVYYKNVVNYEIVNYDSTDVLGVAEVLPFVDNAFDAVISIAVLEHVRDPFSAAREIMRVLKPGGRLICCVPFLQPFHGYPNHYYNMTHVGLANLFRELKVVDQKVVSATGPIHTLVWILGCWLSGLEGKTKQDFLDMRVGDLTGDAFRFVNEPFVTELPEAINFVIASATILYAVKELAAPERTALRTRRDTAHIWSRALARSKGFLDSFLTKT